MELHRLNLVLLSVFLLGAAPSRTQTYVAGNVIDPSEVTENEDNIFTYLQNGVEVIANDSVETADIQNSAVTQGKIATGAVTSTGISDGTIVNADINASADIAASKLADDGIDEEELAATITFPDGDLLDFSAINLSSTSEGILFPQASSCGSATAEGQVCWDTDNILYVGTGSAAQAILSGGTPSLTLSTSNSAGSATTALRTDATIAAFDATAPVTQAFGDTAAAGSAGVAARRDHTHGMPKAAWTFFETVTLDGTSTSSNTLPTGTSVYKLVFDGALATGGTLAVQYTDVTANYDRISLVGNGTTPTFEEVNSESGWELVDEALHLIGECTINRNAFSTTTMIACNLSTRDTDSAAVLVRGKNSVAGKTVTSFTFTATTDSSGDVHIYYLSE